jgi:putative peptide zinc metalloprotease protein
MTATGERPGPPTAVPGGALRRATGVELLGALQGSGYRDGAALVRRGDGQVVQLGPLQYGLLECIDGRRGVDELAGELTQRLGRGVDAEHVVALARKLAAQGLLAGTEQAAPPRANPLLALRWKLLVTDPAVTRRLVGPVTVLFRPWLMWPVLAAFLAVCWFVLVDKGVAGATAEAFRSPGLLLLVFGLGVLSAGAHELGHAAACRYGGATPGGMGVGLYLVWPAFYTDVTDAYRLDRRSRLRVDLAGLYLNAVIAVLTTAVWLLVRRDALLLLVALQLLQMVKQLSPVIRADGYHILADATGVPDLYAHIGPTMRRLVPGGRRSPSALTGRARAVVTVWVLVVVPVLLSLMAGAVLLLPRLLTSAWDSGRAILDALPHRFGSGDVVGGLAGLLQLVALFLPVLGSALVTQRLVRTLTARARTWSAGRPGRRAVAVVAAVAVACGLAWAWWPSGQYQPVRPTDRGSLPSLVHLLGSPRTAVRPTAALAGPAGERSAPVTQLAVAAVPRGGATSAHPALFLLPARDGGVPTAVAVDGTGRSAVGTAFPFRLPAAPRPGDSQALAAGTRDGGVVYDISYALVTVTGGAPVTSTNSAFALAHCTGCTTVAVSFQVVLVVGRSDTIAPINAAGALNYDCPACVTAAIADQIVVTVSQQPSARLQQELRASLATLDQLPQLGADATPGQIAAQVAAVQQQIETTLTGSGILTGQLPGGSASSSSAAGSSSAAAQPSAGTSSTAASTAAAPSQQSGSTTSSSAAAASSPDGTAAPSTAAELTPTP